MKKHVGIVLAAALVAGAAAPALAGDDARAPRRGHRRGRAEHAMRQRRQRAADFLASLNATDDQRRLVLEKARAAAPIVGAAKDEARRIVAEAWASKDGAPDHKTDRKAVRQAVRDRIRALREKVRADLEPLAREVVASLTPEQRQRFQEAAGKRGRTIDDAKLTRFATRLISRPMTVSYLEARLKR